jgi:hypothetical protein
MNIRKYAVSIAIMSSLSVFQVSGQSISVRHQNDINLQGVPVMFGDSKAMGDSGLGLSKGVGQFGAPTVFACFYNYRTMVIADFPANISSGWIITNQKSDQSCIAPGGMPQPNWQEETYYLDLPIGTVLKVCWEANTWPASWTPINYAKDPNMCGYWPSGVPIDGEPNVMYIKRMK